MNIVKPSVTVIHHTPNPERVIERMGRICYQSTHKIKDCEDCDGKGELLDKSIMTGGWYECRTCNGTGTDISSANAFVKMILKNRHTSVLEHASAGVSVITDRGVTHEIVRHRIGVAFSQESTRYCNYIRVSDSFSGSPTFIKPPDMTASQEQAWMEAMQHCSDIYRRMIDLGCTPQIARSVLPNSLKSEIGITMDFQAWRHFLELRLSPKAHPQMRQVARLIRDELFGIAPVVFEEYRDL